MGTIGALIFLVLAAFVGMLIGALWDAPLLGGIMLVLIVGFVCVIYYLDKPPK